MFGIPLQYNIRNLFVRRVSTSLTVLGIALVVAIFLCVMALAEGLSSVFRASGEKNNLLILRRNAQAELQSIITREQATMLTALSGIDRDADGQPIASTELIYIVNLPKRGGGVANVTMRGAGPKAMALRPKMRLSEGRMFTVGLNEVIVSESIARRFADVELGQVIKFGSIRWTVVGHFDAEGTAANSEIWGDIEGLMNDFRRNTYQSVLMQVSDRAGRDQVKAQIAQDPRLPLDPRGERAYYQEQMATAEPIKFLGLCIAVILAIGACFGAMNTMYAAVANRTPEIATMRAIGFTRTAILISFVLESTILGLAGGLIGSLLGALAVKFAFAGVTGTMNMATFSEVVFAFRLTPGLIGSAILFSLLMGFFGGLLPASRAAFTRITVALRQVA